MEGGRGRERKGEGAREAERPRARAGGKELRGVTKVLGFQLVVLHLPLLGQGCVQQPLFLHSLLENFFVLVRLEQRVHEEDAHVAEPRAELVLLFILGFFFFLWKKVSLK